ncbi:EVX1 isoform 4 [Pan troglodytes]|uniref:EVX1 isoform 4 n=1 Tax=Pan troglodytes TaxID=9598 RepID=A0A2J8KZ66_PANTR|nr:EVX1 isoform 4 [Pan troglodytes]
MESRKDMVVFLDGGQLGTLVGKRVSNLSEAVGSPLPEPPEKMVPRGCLSPRAVPPATRERGGGGPEEEPVDGLAGSAAGPGAEPRVDGAAMLGPGPPAPSVDSVSGQGQPSSSDTESDFYEEIEGPAPRRWSAVRTEGARPPRATAAVVGAARKAPWRAAPVTRCVVTAPPSPESRLRGWRRNSTGRTTYPGRGDVSWRPP